LGYRFDWLLPGTYTLYSDLTGSTSSQTITIQGVNGEVNHVDLQEDVQSFL
jgi:hypothetical protein